MIRLHSGQCHGDSVVAPLSALVLVWAASLQLYAVLL